MWTWTDDFCEHEISIWTCSRSHLKALRFKSCKHMLVSIHKVLVMENIMRIDSESEWMEKDWNYQEWKRAQSCVHDERFSAYFIMQTYLQTPLCSWDSMDFDLCLSYYTHCPLLEQDNKSQHGEGERNVKPYPSLRSYRQLIAVGKGRISFLQKFCPWLVNHSTVEHHISKNICLSEMDLMGENKKKCRLR